MAEYTVVFVLAVLVAITGVDLNRPAASTDQASAGPDRRPALVRTVDGFARLAQRLARVGPWRPTARTRPPSTTTPTPRGPGDGPLPGSPVDQEARVTLKFSDLNPLGRAIIVTVAVLTFGVAAVSFATSYGALYAYIRDTGLYSERLTRLWPLLLDGAFIVAQLAAILAGILRGSRAGRS